MSNLLYFGQLNFKFEGVIIDFSFLLCIEVVWLRWVILRAGSWRFRIQSGSFALAALVRNAVQIGVAQRLCDRYVRSVVCVPLHHLALSD